MAAERIYYEDCYAREFQATVTAVTSSGAVLLSQTTFYPSSGGQEDDRGNIASVEVVAVEEHDGEVFHVLGEASPDGLEPGATVTGVIDWGRRYRLMQQHTGQHLLSAVAQKLLGWKTVGVHIGLSHATVEFATSAWSADQLRELEQRANEEIAAARPVTILRGPEADLLPLRKATERADDLRVVSIEGLDHSACGGTHVRSTAEIGGLLLGATERIRKNLRIEFFCGLIAMERARQQREVLAAVAAALKCPWSDSPRFAMQRSEEVLRLTKQEKSYVRELNQWRGRAARTGLAPEAGNPVCAVRWVTSSPAEAERAYGNAFCEQPATILLTLCATSGAFMLSCSASGDFDASAWLKQTASAVGARGGGSTTQVTGKVEDASSVKELTMLLPTSPVLLETETGDC